MLRLWNRPVWAWLVVGILLRIVAIDAPIFGNSNLRQTQTAVVTQSIGEEGGLALGGKVTWLGDRESRLLMEPPLYNYLVLAVHSLGVPLDASGKLTSIALWALSFLILQDILRRLCPERARFWASYLFVIAPISVYFGQSFMPEMLIQCAGLGFVALLLRYVQDERLSTFAALASVGGVGMLLKAPEISHLYLLAALLLWRKAGWRGLLRVRYVVALALTVAAMRWWSVELDRTNALHFPEWTSANVMRLMLGSWEARFDLFQYARLAVYIVLLLTTLGGLPVAALGVRELIQRREQRFAIGAWVLSVGFAYVFWAGSASREHSYYNLPTLAPACLLFGLGCERFIRSSHGTARPGLLVAVTALPALAMCLFLFTQDRTLERATAWLREHTEPQDLILVHIAHRTDMSIYRHISTVAYYAQRRVWAPKFLPPEERERALGISAWVLTTAPTTEPGAIEKLRRWIKRAHIVQDEHGWPSDDARFERHHDGDGFAVYRRRAVQ